MKSFSTLSQKYRQVQSAEEIDFLFPDNSEHSCQLWSSLTKQQFQVKLTRQGERFNIQVSSAHRSETVFFVHCPKLSYAMKFKTIEEKTEDDKKIISASLIKWVRPEYRGMIRNKVAKTKAFLYIDTASEKRVIAGFVKNFNFYGCQLQFNKQYEEILRRIDPKNIGIKIKSENEIPYYGNICYLTTQKDDVFIGIHFPDGCSAKVQFDNWS